MEKVAKRKFLEMRTIANSAHIPGFARFSVLLIKTCSSPETFNLVLIVQTISEKGF